MKIQTKTTILFTILTAAIYIILNITIYFFINNFAHNDFNKRLELRARISAKFRFEQGELSTEAFREIQKQYLEKLPEEEAFILQIDTLTKKSLEPTPKAFPVSFITDVVNANGATVYYQNRFRSFAGLLYKTHDGKYYTVIKSATNKYGNELMSQLAIIKLVSLIISVLLIYSVGLYFSKRTFKPIRDIINSFKQISQANLHLRLKEQEGTDEIAELTSTFNQMLNRLETAFETQNNFISNASHEFRTPLTAIVGEADYALSKEREPEAYKESLQQIILQAEKLQALTKGLLALAQTGFDGKKLKWENIRLDQLFFDVKENCNAVLPENKIKVDLGEIPTDEQRISVKGNYDLLKIAIGNIVMNACKYSHNAPVDFKLVLFSETADIIVKDNGVGIPQDELKHIYDPFFRASNVQQYDGYGIGMPLSNNIIRLHKGSISVNSIVNEGTEVIVSLPLI